MKQHFAFLVIILSVACTGRPTNTSFEHELPLFHPDDKAKVESYFVQFGADIKKPPGELMVATGLWLLGTPYVPQTLETDESEKMVINLREMDCTTFIENCLALVRALRSREHRFERFVSELEHVRYRHGKRDGYTSRLHYFSDWLYDNSRKKVLKDISREIAHMVKPNNVDFMSTHPGSYPVLASNPALVDEIATIEQQISQRITWFVPKDMLPEKLDLLADGDIVALTSNIKGLDVSHMGMIIRSGDEVKLLHAGSNDGKVVVSSDNLTAYLKGRKSVTGIMVARVI